MYKLRFTTGWIRVSDTGSIRNDYLAVQNQQTALASVIIINDAEKYKLLYFNEIPILYVHNGYLKCLLW